LSETAPDTIEAFSLVTVGTGHPLLWKTAPELQTFKQEF
jgi:hypothetical protein